MFPDRVDLPASTGHHQRGKRDEACGKGGKHTQGEETMKHTQGEETMKHTQELAKRVLGIHTRTP